jgi:hypothetical protein
MTKEQLAGQTGDHDHDHPETSDWNTKTIFFASTTALLLLLILINGFVKRTSSKA